MKARYSFKAFGEPFLKRPNQDVKNSVFRQTLQEDTPYYVDQNEAVDVNHALVDPSHTFIEDGRHFYGKGKSIHHLSLKNFRKSYNIFEHDKTRGQDLSLGHMQQKQRVTYDFKGKPIVKLAETEPSVVGRESNPVNKYMETKETNQEFFKQLNRAHSLKDRLKISQKFDKNNPMSLVMNKSIMNQTSDSAINCYLQSLTQKEGHRGKQGFGQRKMTSDASSYFLKKNPGITTHTQRLKKNVNGKGFTFKSTGRGYGEKESQAS